MGLPNVVKKLKGIQVRKGLTDKEMGDRLGCSRQLYQMTRTDKTRLGNKILKGISAAFPELQQDVIYFLSNGDKKLSGSAQNPSRTPSEAQGRELKRFFGGLLARIRERLIFKKGVK